MKSYAFEDFSPKRIKKLAAQFSEDEIRASLGEDDDNRAFLFERPDGGTSFKMWNAFHGPMGCLDDDSVRVYAQVEFLRRHNYPVARSLDDIHDLVDKYGWPRKGPFAQRPTA